MGEIVLKILALDVQNLSKTYTRVIKAPGLWGAVKGLIWQKKRSVPAVNDLSFQVELGKAVGLIGENGAGKSTTMKCLCGILKPNGGELSVLGHRPWRERRALARKIGVVFGQRPQLLWDIAVRETFALNRVMYRVPDSIFSETSALCIDMLELKPLLDVPVRQLSLGQRMRCDLACAMLHAPQMAFLDEPTIGLDVLAKEQARRLIKVMRRRFGMSLILTTHDLKDISDICERVVLLDKGSLLFDGSLKKFEARYAREKRMVVELGKLLTPARRKAMTVTLKRLGGKVLPSGENQLIVAFERASAVHKLTQALVRSLDIADMTFEKTDLETVVRRLYARQGENHAG